jgi:ubiquinone/menaquinone biosynthesis C-methylase UbiE
MPNDEMAEFWNDRGGSQWVAERDRYDRMLEPCGARLLAAAALQPGERVLDVGCGNGAATLEAADRVGPTGRTVGVDVSAPMLAIARERAAAASVAATFVEADAQVASLDGPFDAAVSRFGVMFFDDPVAAFSNLAAALAPGGRLAFTCWKDLFSNQWIAVPAAAVIAHVGIPELPKEGEPGPFAFADPTRVEKILSDAGFESVVFDDAADQLVLGSDVDDVIDFFVRDELGRRVFEGKEPDQVAAAVAAARAALEPFATSGGVALEGAYWVVSARRG